MTNYASLEQDEENYLNRENGPPPKIRDSAISHKKEK